MSNWVEQQVELLLTAERPLTLDERAMVASMLKQLDAWLVARTTALYRIGIVVDAPAGTDLVHELPDIVAQVLKRKGEQ
ncbi:hypothetical protein OKW45_001984 [Paraburkholderia sp. WSM4175]|uniref:hypothetical protein n=1 Tax=Paraburkholderia sp. WSM4175 TaxID=2991072 RepID=UPI003D23E719